MKLLAIHQKNINLIFQIMPNALYWSSKRSYCITYFNSNYTYPYFQIYIILCPFINISKKGFYRGNVSNHDCVLKLVQEQFYSNNEPI